MTMREDSWKRGDGCATDAALEALLEGASDEAVETHLAGCAACAARLEAMREDAALVGELREAVGGREQEDKSLEGGHAGYEIRGEIHRGGQGVVYRAWHAPTRREVALKVLTRGAFSGVRERARFEREVELAAGLRHPGVVTVYDSGFWSDGQPYIAMELIEGEPLDAYVARKRLDARGIAALVASVAGAVAAAHQRGVLHRDIKPANILVDAQGFAKLVDFGLAKTVEADRTEVTQGGEFVGTLAYAAPEQVHGGDAPDVRLDVYALGVVMYRLLTGRLPFHDTKSVATLIRKIVEEDPPAPWKVDAGIPSELSAITMMALEKEPARRYSSAEALAEDLRAFIEGRPVRARGASSWYIARKFVARHRALVAAAGIALLALAGAAVGATAFALREAEARRTEARLRGEADAERDVALTVGEFLDSMLSAPVPDQLGREVRVLDVLDAASGDLAQLEDQPRVLAQVRHTLGSSYMQLGELERADALLAGASEGYGALLGEDDMRTIEARSDLGVLYTAQGRVDEAAPLLTDVLDRLGDDDSARAREIRLAAMASLAEIHHYYTGDLAQAETLLIETLAGREATLGPSHYDTLESMRRLANVRLSLGRVEEAEAGFELAVARAREAYGDDDLETAEAMHDLAALYVQTGRRDEAEPLAAQAVRVSQRELGAQHIDTAQMAGTLATIYLFQERRAEAEPLFLDVIAAFTREVGESHPATLNMTVTLGALYTREEAWDKGIALLERPAQLHKETLGDHTQTALCELWLGMCLTGAGRYEEAEARLLDAHRIQEASLGAEHSRTHHVIKELVALYETWGEATGDEAVLAEGVAWRARLPAEGS